MNGKLEWLLAGVPIFPVQKEVCWVNEMFHDMLLAFAINADMESQRRNCSFVLFSFAITTSKVTLNYFPGTNHNSLWSELHGDVTGKGYTEIYSGAKIIKGNILKIFLDNDCIISPSLLSTKTLSGILYSFLCFKFTVSFSSLIAVMYIYMYIQLITSVCMCLESSGVSGGSVDVVLVGEA